MPFRCKCGRTFEKTDSFASHTSACAPFHHRRMSDTTQMSTAAAAAAGGGSGGSQPFINTSFRFLSSSSQASSPTDSVMMDSDLSSSVPTNNGFFMPTALSLQNAFEGARRRSMSYGSSFK
ncbi:hypothetical protein INT47_004108 [Mucor saturninus]|uniref:Uncharacterized protein n=1 Tax=Mucor saturninus TaxID=64648 RepID=A0A8H7V662_9FUNG|nr:hypothetical protein INT47_004108 [Mucor saturninus]